MGQTDGLWGSPPQEFSLSAMESPHSFFWGGSRRGEARILPTRQKERGARALNRAEAGGKITPDGNEIVRGNPLHTESTALRSPSCCFAERSPPPQPKSQVRTPSPEGGARGTEGFCLLDNSLGIDSWHSTDPPRSLALSFPLLSPDFARSPPPAQLPVWLPTSMSPPEKSPSPALRGRGRVGSSGQRPALSSKPSRAGGEPPPALPPPWGRGPPLGLFLGLRCPPRRPRLATGAGPFGAERRAAPRPAPGTAAQPRPLRSPAWLSRRCRWPEPRTSTGPR